MKPSAPKKNTWWIALIVGVIGIIAHFVVIPYLTAWHFWLVAVAFILLLLSTSMKNL